MLAKLSYLYFLIPWVIAIAFTYQPVYAQVAEICDNAQDDDGDGLIDLNDPDCTCRSTPISHIPNPSFEAKTCCPSGHSQLDCSETWIQASAATTDYFHGCGYFTREQFPVPEPIPDGEAYIGFRNGYFNRESQGNFGNTSGNNSGNTTDGFPGNSNPNWKEYTGACLLAPLEAGRSYTIQFDIGFVSSRISPPMSVVLYGTTDCKNLPFGVDDREFGCPLNGSGWKVLGQVYVSGNKTWKQYKITTIPRQDITAIAIGPDCIELNLDINPYYFLDNLILADSELFGPDIVEVGHPCSADFYIVASEKKNATYQWYRNGVAMPGSTSRELALNGNEGDYQVLVKIDSNCVLSDSYRYSIPFINTQYRKIVCPDEAYRFGDRTLTRSGFYTHTFQTGDGCDSLVELDFISLQETVDSVVDYFFEGNTYRAGPYAFHTPGTADLVLTSSLGCDSLVHLTLEEYALYIPNAFSPNDDGINDYFTVYGSEDFIDIQSMSILDRWGNRVYEQQEYPFRWDGKDKGHNASSGVYVYTLELILHDGSRKLVTGDVTVLR